MGGLRKRLPTILLASACLMCAGCGGTQSMDDCVRIDWNLQECEVGLHDGRRITCVIYDESRFRNGMSCDWSHAK